MRQRDIYKDLRFNSSDSNLGLLVGINQFISGHEEMQVITDSRAGVGENVSRNLQSGQEGGFKFNGVNQ